MGRTAWGVAIASIALAIASWGATKSGDLNPPMGRLAEFWGFTVAVAALLWGFWPKIRCHPWLAAASWSLFFGGVLLAVQLGGYLLVAAHVLLGACLALTVGAAAFERVAKLRQAALDLSESQRRAEQKGRESAEDRLIAALSKAEPDRQQWAAKQPNADERARAMHRLKDTAVQVALKLDALLSPTTFTLSQKEVPAFRQAAQELRSALHALAHAAIATEPTERREEYLHELLNARADLSEFYPGRQGAAEEAGSLHDAISPEKQRR